MLYSLSFQRVVFSILDGLGKLPENFRPPFEEAEEDRFAAELGRDCKKEIKNSYTD